MRENGLGGGLVDLADLGLGEKERREERTEDEGEEGEEGWVVWCKWCKWPREEKREAKAFSLGVWCRGFERGRRGGGALGSNAKGESG